MEHEVLKPSPWLEFSLAQLYVLTFVVAPYMLIILSYFCPTNAHNSYNIVKLLKSFKIKIVAPTCFGLHKPSPGSPQPVRRQSYDVDIGYIYRYLKLSVLWLHIFSVLLCVWVVHCAE